MLTEGTTGDTASTDDAAAWRGRFGLSFPVLADTQGEWNDSWGTVGRWSQRSYVVIGADFTITWRQGDTTPADAEDIIAELDRAR